MLNLLFALCFLFPPPYSPAEGSEFDPAYAASVSHGDDGTVTIGPCDACVLPKTYIDVDMTTCDGSLSITAPPFDLSGGARFVAAGEIVVRFVNPVGRPKD